MREPNKTDFGYNLELHIWEQLSGLGNYITAMREYYEFLTQCSKEGKSGQMTDVEHKMSEILVTKRYTVVEEHRRDGKSRQIRTVEGFNTLELLGLLTYVRKDIIAQMKNKSPKPDIVSKIAIKE